MSQNLTGLTRLVFSNGLLKYENCGRKTWEICALGDNLASHFNLKVIKIAEQNDVYLAMLPSNATHLLQPLDVSVFSLIKKKFWRKILQEWKREVKTKGSFNKQFFPSLLKRLWSTRNQDQ